MVILSGCRDRTGVEDEEGFWGRPATLFLELGAGKHTEPIRSIHSIPIWGAGARKEEVVHTAT